MGIDAPSALSRQMLGQKWKEGRAESTTNIDYIVWGW